MTLLSQWFFKENTGTSVEDDGTGTDLDLAITGGAGSGWTGSGAHIGYIAAATAFISTPTWTTPGTGNKFFDNLHGSKTITMTVAFSSNAFPASQERMVFGLTDTDGSKFLTVWADTAGSFYTDGNALSGFPNLDGTDPENVPLFDGNLHAFTIVIDTNQATASLRVRGVADGVVVMANPTSDGVAQNATLALNAFTFANRFCVGTRGDNNANRKFNGTFYYCDVRSDALSLADIQALHTALLANDNTNPYATPITVTTGRADETDAALALAVSKSVATGRSDETNTALALAASKSVTTGRADETETALGVAASKQVVTGQADETDSALSLGVTREVAPGVATETDEALALTASKSVVIGTADETDSALALAASKVIPASVSVEVDEAFALLDLTHHVALGIAEETDVSLAVPLFRTIATGAAEESDAALSLAAAKIVTIGVAVETDAAFSTFPPSLNHGLAHGRVFLNDTAKGSVRMTA